MKTLFLLIFTGLLLLSSLAANAQTTRLHLFRTSRAGLLTESIFPIQNLGKPLNIPFRTYIVIETNADSIGFDSGKGQGYIRFEKGKNYYFRLRKEANEIVSMVDEVSEQTFKMNLLLSDRPLKPEVVHKLND